MGDFIFFLYILLQASSSEVFQLDTFSKILSLIFLIGGGISGWILINVRHQMGVKFSEMEAKLSQLELSIEKRFNKEREVADHKLREETDRLQKDIELKVATKADVDSMKESAKLQFDNVMLQLKLLAKHDVSIQ